MTVSYHYVTVVQRHDNGDTAVTCHRGESVMWSAMSAIHISCGTALFAFSF